MNGKHWLLAAALTLALPCTVMAGSDLENAARKALPPAITLHPLPGEESLSFLGETIPYEAAQLTADQKRREMFLSGYIFSGVVPQSAAETFAPYFQYHLTEKEFAGLARVNKAFFDENAPLHQAIRASAAQWADRMVGGAGAKLEVELSSIEPIRRVSGVTCILYTAGTKMTLSSEGLILPLYGRAYMYKDGGTYRFVMLITGDDSRRMLTYALEDMVKKAASEAAQRDLKAFVESLPVH